MSDGPTPDDFRAKLFRDRKHTGDWRVEKLDEDGTFGNRHLQWTRCTRTHGAMDGQEAAGMSAAATSPAEHAACENTFSMPESVSFPTFALTARLGG
jgi:hypothetical protein